jgi:hypothetical protein
LKNLITGQAVVANNNIKKPHVNLRFQKEFIISRFAYQSEPLVTPKIGSTKPYNWLKRKYVENSATLPLYGQ